jgi:hypothetical protein
VEEGEAQQLQSMLDGLKTFIAGSSDIDGVTFPAKKDVHLSSGAKASPTERSAGIVAPPAAPVASQDGALALDYAYLQSLLDSVGAGESLPSLPAPAPHASVPASAGASSETEGDEDKQSREQKDLLRYFSQADMEELDSEAGVEDGRNEDDSDSEDSEDDRDGERAADLYLRQVLSSNNKSAFNKGSTAKNSRPAPSSPLRPEPSAAVVSPSVQGVGGGFLRSKNGNGGSASRGAQELDSDDEVEEASSALPAPLPADAPPAVPRAGHGSVDSDDEDEDGFQGGAGDSEVDEVDEEDLEGMYASLDPETIREFQVHPHLLRSIYVATFSCGAPPCERKDVVVITINV